MATFRPRKVGSLRSLLAALTAAFLLLASLHDDGEVTCYARMVKSGLKPSGQRIWTSKVAKMPKKFGQVPKLKKYWTNVRTQQEPPENLADYVTWMPPMDRKGPKKTHRFTVGDRVMLLHPIEVSNDGHGFFKEAKHTNEVRLLNDQNGKLELRNGHGEASIKVIESGTTGWVIDTMDSGEWVNTPDNFDGKPRQSIIVSWDDAMLPIECVEDLAIVKTGREMSRKLAEAELKKENEDRERFGLPLIELRPDGNMPDIEPALPGWD